MSGPPRLGQALAVSALAHAAVLGALLVAVRPSPPPPPLLLHLLRRPAMAEASGPSRPVEAMAGAARPFQRARPLPEGRRWAESSNLETRAVSVQTAPGAPAAGGPPDEAPAPAASGGGAVGAPSGAGPGAASASLLGELHRRLAEAARRCYPAAAQRHRLQGEVPVHFCLDGQGVATALSLEGSTGFPLLDRSALECVVPGAEPLAGLAGCFSVPVHFGG